MRELCHGEKTTVENERITDDETDQSDVDGRPARRVFRASLCGGEGRRRAVARYEVVGDAVANLTTDLRLENRILYVRLQSSVVRQELFYQREALRDRINEVSKVRLVNAVIVK